MTTEPSPPLSPFFLNFSTTARPSKPDAPVVSFEKDQAMGSPVTTTVFRADIVRIPFKLKSLYLCTSDAMRQGETSETSLNGLI